MAIEARGVKRSIARRSTAMGCFLGLRLAVDDTPSPACHSRDVFSTLAPGADLLREAFRVHRTVLLVAKHFRVSRRTVYRWLARHPELLQSGVSRSGPGRALSVEREGARGAVVAALARGATLADAAREGGVSRSTAERWARDGYSGNGMPRKGPGRPRGTVTVRTVP